MRKTILLVSLFLLLVGILHTGCIRSTYKKYSDITYKEIPGVDPNLLSLDIYVPKVYPNSAKDKENISDEPFPVMIWVHGGAWIMGDKSNNLGYKIPLFIGSKWIFVSVNYRLSPREIPSDPNDLDPDRVKYPVHCQDVAAAIAWVHQHIDEYGGDPNQISLMGHSAGAYIVSAIATNESFLAEYGLNLSIIKHVVSLDTEAYDIGYVIENSPPSFAMVYMNAFGTDPDTWYDASPINHIETGKPIPSFFVVTRGNHTRINISERFVNKLKEAGVYAEIIYALNYSHSEVNDAIGNPNDDIITPALREFLGLSDSYIFSYSTGTVNFFGLKIIPS